MTIPDLMAAAPAQLDSALVAAADAVAAHLPWAEPVSPGVPVSVAGLDLPSWPAAAHSVLSSAPGCSVGILVRHELVDALAAAPSGALDLGAALQPALDAAAAALGSTAGFPEKLEGPALDEVVGTATGVVPLHAGPDVVAVVFATLDSRTTAVPAAPAPLQATPAVNGVELLHGVAMEVTVELGRTQMSVRELLSLAPGEVLELDRPAGGPADLLVNGRLIARGEVVVVDEDFALRVTEIVSQPRAI